MNKVMFVAVTSLFALSACGGGGGNSTPEPQPVQYSRDAVVIDGYVRDALVYVDLNENGSQDEGEPSAFTDDAGYAFISYEHLGPLPKDFSEYPLIARIIAGQSYDMGTQTEFERDYEFIAADGGMYLTPFTTVGRHLASTDMTPAGLHQALRLAFGVNNSDLEQFAGDYVAQPNSYYRFLVELLMQELPDPDSPDLAAEWATALDRISRIAGAIEAGIDQQTPESIDWIDYQLTWDENNQPELLPPESPEPPTPPSVNQPPELNLPAEIEFSFNQEFDLSVEISDPENNAVTVSWRLVDGPENGDLIMRVANDFRRVTLSAWVLGRYTIQVDVSDGVNQVSEQVAVDVVNYAPTYAAFFLHPENASAESEILAFISDLNDFEMHKDYLNVTYHWSINGESVAEEHSRYLASGLAIRGDMISAYAEISDGTNTVVTPTVSLTLVNAAPRSGDLALPDPIPNTTEAVTVALPALYDADGDELTTTFEWRINGTLVTDIKGDTLPAGRAKKSDEVQIIATVSDGIDTDVSDPASLIISDAPAVVNIDGLPNEVNHKQLLEFSLIVSDPDEDTVEIEKAYGPSGMQVDAAGQVSWTPNEVMLLDKEQFSFAIRTVSEGEVILEDSIQVTDLSRKAPIARSGIEVPYRNYSMWVSDFDGDGKNEIVMTDTNNRIFTLEHDGEDYFQDWMYPLRLPTAGAINQILLHDLDGDGSEDIVAIAEDGISSISGPAAHAKLLFSSPEENLIAAAIGNIDSDEALEIAVLTGDNYSSGALSVYQLDTWSLEMSSVLSEGGTSVLIGNVDTDSALELIVSSGYVFDGNTGDNEWYFADGFGDNLAVGDVDNDGIDEILGTPRWGNPKLYDAVVKSELWEIENDDICTLNITNVDADPQDELLVGNCQWGEVTVYDAISGTPTEQVKWSTVEHASVSVTAGDVNNDGEVEVLWGSGITSTGEDVLVIGDVSTEEIAWYNQDPSQLGSFVAAGWAKLGADDEQAVFVVPETDSGYSGQRIVTLSEQGQLRLSDEIGSNWDNARHGVVVDYDGDDVSEIFLATAQLYDGEFQVRQLDDFSLEWGGAGGDYEDNIRVVIATDMNSDGHQDAIFANGSKVQIVDVFNQTNIWTSTSFSGYVQDVATMASSESGTKVLVADSSQLTIWIANNTGYLREATAELACTRITAGDVNGDGEQEVFCLVDGGYYRTTSTLAVLDSALQTIRTLTIDGAITDLMLEQSSAAERNLLMAVIPPSESISPSSENSELRLVSPVTGDTIWRSPVLIGRMPDHSMHYLPHGSENKRLTFATQDAMYLTH